MHIAETRAQLNVKFVYYSKYITERLRIKTANYGRKIPETYRELGYSVKKFRRRQAQIK